jgi:uncharacterized protein (DUF2249 family)
MAMSGEAFLDLDVRPLFAAKRAPLPAILDAVSNLVPGQALRLTAPIEPAPLYQMLARQGFSHETSRTPDGAWVIIFRR